MGYVHVLPISDNQSIAKNASIVSDARPSFRFGPDDKWHIEASISGGGACAFHLLIANAIDDNFISAVNASNLCIAKSSVSLASRGHFPNFPVSTVFARWYKIKIKEQNASPAIVTANLVWIKA